jgi:hypothetical protein
MDNLQANDYNQTVSTKTASYTLVAADKGTRVVMNSASATTITVNTSLFSAGDTLVLQNISTGVCTVTAVTATVSTAGSLAIPQNGSGTLYFTSAGVSIFYPSAATAGALTFITGASYSAVTNVSLPANTFSSTYQNYLVIFNNTTATSTCNLTLRLRASGTDATAGNYQNMLKKVTNVNTEAIVGTNGQTSFFMADQSASTLYTAIVNVQGPNLAQRTIIYPQIFGETAGTSQNSFVGVSAYADTTQYDSLTLISSVATNITGNYKVYGYANS